MVVTSEPPSTVVAALRHLDRASLRAHLPPTCTALHGVYTFAADGGYVHARLTPVADDAPTPVLTRNGSASGQRRATPRGVFVRKRRVDYEMVHETCGLKQTPFAATADHVQSTTHAGEHNIAMGGVHVSHP